MKIKSVMEMIFEADALVQTLNVAEAKAHLEADSAIFIDLRDIREVAKTGKVRGAHHVPRGMLEFWIDPQSPYHKDFFKSDQKLIFYCAGGWRSALAAKTAQEMGLQPVAHLEGGMTAWIEAAGAIDPPKEKYRI